MPSTTQTEIEQKRYPVKTEETRKITRDFCNATNVRTVVSHQQNLSHMKLDKIVEKINLDNLKTNCDPQSMPALLAASFISYQIYVTLF